MSALLRIQLELSLALAGGRRDDAVLGELYRELRRISGDRKTPPKVRRAIRKLLTHAVDGVIAVQAERYRPAIHGAP